MSVAWIGGGRVQTKTRARRVVPVSGMRSRLAGSMTEVPPLVPGGNVNNSILLVTCIIFSGLSLNEAKCGYNDIHIGMLLSSFAI